MGTKLLTPKETLNNGFRNIPLKWCCVSPGVEDDGRWLYEIETDTLEYQEVILEGLQMWGVHLKTLESAKLLLEKLSGRNDISIVGDKLYIPPIENNLGG